MVETKRKTSLLLQVTIVFIVVVLLAGLFTYVTQRLIAEGLVRKQMERTANDTAEEIRLSIREFPAYQWLLTYWYDHAEEMDIEYDADFSSSTETEAKSKLLQEHHPELSLRYATEAEIKALSKEEQKLYAEVLYSWLITHINQIKRSYDIDFLFGVVTDETYTTQFFMFSAAEEGAVRGTNYEEVYPLGHIVTVSESQLDAMKSATENESHLASAGDYLDYYAYLDTIGNKVLLIGLTYNLTDIQQNALTQAAHGTASALTFQIILSAIYLALIFALILLPLKKVQQGIQVYKETKDSDAVLKSLGEMHSGNEIGQLTRDFAELAQEIDEHVDEIKTITAEKERIVTELSMAQTIQSSMMPSIFPPFPERTEFDVFASMEPAKVVGGDFYDFFLINEDHLGIVMADVSGKGIPAALLMMAVKIILKNCAMLNRSASEILTKTNEAICSNNKSEMFITVWMGILEISTGKLTASNAGHEYPIIAHKDGFFDLYKDPHGFVIGGLDGSPYDEYEIQLEPGAKLFLYTDGLTEATDANGKMFGMQNLLQVLNQNSQSSAQDVLQNVRKAVDSFVQEAEQFDDITMLCLEYKGPKCD